jgi:hypothetical protein
MDAYDIPPELPYGMRPLPELRRMTSSATAWRLSSQYAKLAVLLPGLITDLTATALNSAGHEQEQAFALLALAYRAADAIADKHGRHDMSGRATELIRWVAVQPSRYRDHRRPNPGQQKAPQPLIQLASWIGHP